MNVLLLIDPDFAARERAMLRRVEVGLADDGLHVFHAIPREALRDDHGLSARVITFVPDHLGFTLRGRARAFIADLRAAYPQEMQQGIDAVHVLGKRWWPLGEQIAGALNAALLIELWRASSVPRAQAVARRSHAAFIASDPGLLRAMREAGLGDRTRAAPWGVHAPNAPREILPGDRQPALMVLGSCEGPGAIQNVVTGIAQAARESEGFLVFIDASLAPKSHLWRVARECGILDKLSIIEDMEGARDIVLQGDLLLIPSAMGEHRSIVLDAMAQGMLVLSPRDSRIEALDEPTRARLVPRADPSSWASAIASSLADPPRARATGAAAWAYVREHRKATSQIAGILDAYDWVRAKPPMPFENVVR